MPLYDYTCQRGHRQELIRPIGTEGVPCPACGGAAIRSHVHHFDVVGPTVDSRGLYRRYTEASAEISYAATKQGVPGPRLWPQTKRRVKQMIAAGEAPYPPRKE